MYDTALLYTGLALEVPRLAARSLWNHEPQYPCTSSLLCERIGRRHKVDCPISRNWKGYNSVSSRGVR